MIVLLPVPRLTMDNMGSCYSVTVFSRQRLVKWSVEWISSIWFLFDRCDSQRVSASRSISLEVFFFDWIRFDAVKWHICMTMATVDYALCLIRFAVIDFDFCCLTFFLFNVDSSWLSTDATRSTNVNTFAGRILTVTLNEIWALIQQIYPEQWFDHRQLAPPFPLLLLMFEGNECVPSAQLIWRTRSSDVRKSILSSSSERRSGMDSKLILPSICCLAGIVKNDQNILAIRQWRKKCNWSMRKCWQWRDWMSLFFDLSSWEKCLILILFFWSMQDQSSF